MTFEAIWINFLKMLFCFREFPLCSKVMCNIPIINVEELLDLIQDTTLHFLQIFAKRFVSAVVRELSTSVNWFWHHRFGKKARSYFGGNCSGSGWHDAKIIGWIKVQTSVENELGPTATNRMTWPHGHYLDGPLLAHVSAGIKRRACDVIAVRASSLSAWGGWGCVVITYC